MGFPDGSVVKNPPAMEEMQEMWVDPWMKKMPWRREWRPTPSMLPGKSHRQRSLAGDSPWGCKRVRHNCEATKHTHIHTHTHTHTIYSREDSESVPPE